MAFQVSPGVQVKEIDATNVVPAVSTSIGGFAGAFVWGPASEVVTVGSENELAEKFGAPIDADTAKHFLNAASFLKYGNALKVVRGVGSTAVNATGGTTGRLVSNETEYDQATLAAGTDGQWIAKYPGAIGNSLQVEVCTNATAFGGWAQAGQFEAAPSTSDYVKGKGLATGADEMHIAVIDEEGLFTGTRGTVLETFSFLSQASDAKDSSGSSLFYKDVINNKSEYIWWATHDTGLTKAGDTVQALIAAEATAYVTSDTVLVEDLGLGVSDNALSAGEVTTALDYLADGETVDVNLLFAAPDADGVDTIGEKLISIAEARKDCIAFISPPIDDSTGTDPVTDVVAYANLLPSTSYASLDSGAVYLYDKYNDVYRWIGSNGLCAGLCANTDSVADAWFSPAGVNRGQLLGVAKLAYNPTKAQRDTLYKARINPLVSFPGQGTMLFGDKTLLSRASAFDRINVRRLFIVIEKAISTAAKSQLFEFNDEFTRAQFRNLLEPFLRDVKGRRGITDFLVVCDESNNTGQVIDTNRFVADIFVKPARSINFITLNFIATRTGVDFTEVAGG